MARHEITQPHHRALGPEIPIVWFPGKFLKQKFHVSSGQIYTDPGHREVVICVGSHRTYVLPLLITIIIVKTY